MSRKSQIEEARETIRALVDALETDDKKPILSHLMMAQRFARLMRDEEAQQWLEYETQGYPKEGEVDLGPYGRYALRFTDGKLTNRTSLPEVQAQAEAAASILSATQNMLAGQEGGTVDNYLAGRATQELLHVRVKKMTDARQGYVSWSNSYSRMKSMLHQYAVDALLGVEFGDAAEEIFEAARSDVDVFVSTKCPKAVEQLLAVNDRLRDGTNEDLSSALTSCRRVLVTVADAVFPPRDQPYKDGRGKERPVGPDEHKNRLLAFIETRVSSGSTRAILGAQISETAARLDAVNDKACKGVHDDVTIEEARLVVIHTYLLIAEIARLAKDSPPAVVAAPDAAEASQERK